MSNYFYTTNKVKLWIIFCILMILCVLCACAWRIISINQVQLTSVFYNELEAIMYPLSQVVEGKTILADLPSQYGLFPQFLKPIFLVFPLNVLSFSCTMFILQFISMLVIIYVLLRLIKNKLLFIMGTITLISFTFNNLLFFVGHLATYYQYWPIRFFWPALSIGIFYFFCLNRNLYRAFLVSLTAPLAIMWNLDTGIFVFITFFVYLSTMLLISLLSTVKLPLGSSRINLKQLRTRNWFFALINHLCVGIIVCLSGLLYLYVSAGHELNLNWLYQYQKIFVALGFMLLPIPISPSPWMAVMAIYLYAFIAALYGFKKHKFNLQNNLLFYLSILGIGLFTYYEGRSHINNLLNVMWPSIIIGLILTDTNIKYIKYFKVNLLHYFFPVTFITFTFISSLIFLYNIPQMYKLTNNNIIDYQVPMVPLVINELDFIKKHTKNHKECLLLMKRSAIYYAEAQLSSPMKGPGLIELILNSDLVNFKNQILNSPPQCVFIGITPYSFFNLGIDYPALFNNYSILDKNSAGTLVFLKPK